MSSETYWRCEAYAGYFDTVQYIECLVDKHTPCGVVLDLGYRKQRVQERRQNGEPIWHRYAWPTKAEALESLYRRKLKQQGIVEQKLADVLEVLRIVEKERKHPSYIPALLEAPK